MPRHPDPKLEDRILHAARRLWTKGGEKALTLRAVARAAGTNTPAVYRRFRDRHDILRRLLLRIRQDFTDVLENAPSPEQACEQYLDFALSHPNEYELFHQHGYEFLHKSRSGRESAQEARPGVEAMKRKLAAKLGGSPDDYTRLALSLWALGHGTAMLYISRTILPEFEQQTRSVFRAAVKLLLREHAQLSREN